MKISAVVKGVGGKSLSLVQNRAPVSAGDRVVGEVVRTSFDGRGDIVVEMEITDPAVREALSRGALDGVSG